MSAAVYAFPNHIDVVPFAEEDGPFGVLLVRGRREDVLALGLNLPAAVSIAIDEARVRRVPVSANVIRIDPDAPAKALAAFYDGDGE